MVAVAGCAQRMLGAGCSTGCAASGIFAATTRCTMGPMSELPAVADATSCVEKLQALQAEQRSLAKVVAALRPLPRILQSTDLVAALQKLAKLEAKVAALGEAGSRGVALVQAARSEIEQQRQRGRERLGSELRAACEARGLGFRVVSREEPVEVRIPPLAVVIDREKGRAELRFARQPLAACAAQTDEILAAHAAAVETLQQGFDAKDFFAASLRAWRAARAAADPGPQAGDRVEILDFLPHLALQLQGERFRANPKARNYREYTRARFAFDVLQLQRLGKLVQNRQRLNLGVATGTTASQRNRAIWLEDEHGEGEFKLTVYFSEVS
jgi:hypothetical protein